MEATARGRGPFYGWWMVLLASLGLFLNAGLSVWALGLFFLPMQRDLGWSRAALSLAITIRVISMMIASPAIGALVDKRHGVRLLMTLGGLLDGGALLLVGRAHSLWEYYLAFGVMGGVASAAYGEVVGSTLVSKWFVRKRGRAIALYSIGSPLSGVVMVPIVQAIISAWGWRQAWMGLGAMVWLLIVPLAALAARRSPEDMGLLPDGGGDNPAAAQVYEEKSFTLGAAMRSPAFWYLLAAFNLGGLGLAGITVHQAAYVEGRNFSSGQAAASLTIAAALSTLVKLPRGLLAERIKIRQLLWVAFLGCALSVVILVGMNSLPLLVLYAMGWGIFGGAYVPLSSLSWANYFGRTFLGTIRGVTGLLGSITRGIAPFLVAYIYDLTGNYTFAFTVFAGVFLLAGILAFLARSPQPERRQAWKL